MPFYFSNWTWLGVVLGSLGVWFLPIPGVANSATAAEKIYISYGAIERSISVNSLEGYAKEGIIDDDLATLKPQGEIQFCCCGFGN